ncbi:MAG: CRISPR-associated endonuclease Cas1 [Anaerolineae bacterium]|nr:CRISPR-associated endonuclease Cas1 [Anaerolineae bacterium]
MAIIEDLVVSEYGAFVGLKGKRLRVSLKEAAAVEAPLLHLRSVQIATRSASLSAAALAACAEAGIPIHFVDAVEGHYAMMVSPYLTTVVATRRHQIAALENGTGVSVARALAAGKIRSQAAHLRYQARRQPEEMAHSLKQTAIDLLAESDRIADLEASTLEEVRAEMMGREGYCARLYWGAIGQLIPSSYDWPGRTGRHATDPINCLLNYGYGILYGEVQNALVIAGLEPHVGLIHTDRPGKPSLVLDQIEEFRAPIVDRTMLGLANRGYEVRFDGNGRLEREFRKNYAGHILSRLSAQGKYQGKRYTLRSIIQWQARTLAAALRGEQEYQAYTGG